MPQSSILPFSVSRHLKSESDALRVLLSNLPEAARAAQVAEVSVGGHAVVGLAAQNDGGRRRDCRDETVESKTTL